MENTHLYANRSKSNHVPSKRRSRIKNQALEAAKAYLSGIYRAYGILDFFAQHSLFEDERKSTRKAQFFPLAFVLPFFGIVAALSSLTKFSPIYKTTKEDLPLIVLFALVFLLFPIYAHLHEIQKLVIADVISTPAWITSLCLAIASCLIFFVRLRKNHILLGIPIMMGLLATSIGALLGAIIFKLLSLAD